MLPPKANSVSTDVVQNYLTHSLDFCLPRHCGKLTCCASFFPFHSFFHRKRIVNLKCKCVSPPRPIMLVLMRCKICTLMTESYLVLGAKKLLLIIAYIVETTNHFILLAH